MAGNPNCVPGSYADGPPKDPPGDGPKIEEVD